MKKQSYLMLTLMLGSFEGQALSYWNPLYALKSGYNKIFGGGNPGNQEIDQKEINPEEEDREEGVEPNGEQSYNNFNFESMPESSQGQALNNKQSFFDAGNTIPLWSEVRDGTSPVESWGNPHHQELEREKDPLPANPQPTYRDLIKKAQASDAAKAREEERPLPANPQPTYRDLIKKAQAREEAKAREEERPLPANPQPTYRDLIKKAKARDAAKALFFEKNGKIWVVPTVDYLPGPGGNNFSEDWFFDKKMKTWATTEDLMHLKAQLTKLISDLKNSKEQPSTQEAIDFDFNQLMAPIIATKARSEQEESRSKVLGQLNDILTTQELLNIKELSNNFYRKLKIQMEFDIEEIQTYDEKKYKNDASEGLNLKFETLKQKLLDLDQLDLFPANDYESEEWENFFNNIEGYSNSDKQEQKKFYLYAKKQIPKDIEKIKNNIFKIEVSGDTRTKKIKEELQKYLEKLEEKNREFERARFQINKIYFNRERSYLPKFVGDKQKQINQPNLNPWVKATNPHGGGEEKHKEFEPARSQINRNYFDRQTPYLSKPFYDEQKQINQPNLNPRVNATNPHGGESGLLKHEVFLREQVLPERKPPVKKSFFDEDEH
jgi:hypothetical protein